MITIYKVVDQEDRTVYYVGSTEAFLKRKDTHIRDLANDKHPNKKLQKLYNEGKRFRYEVVVEYDKLIINRFVMEYLVTSYLRPVTNKTFNMSQTKRCFNMKLIEQDLAERLYKVVMQSL